MTYLEEFQTQINTRNFTKFFQLWEEYVTNDQVDVEEFSKILDVMKASDFASRFGDIIETALPLWQQITDEEESFQVLKRIIDLQTTNSPTLAKLTLDTIEKRYGNDPEYKERIRLVGLRTLEKFQGALSNYEILYHLKPGNFVYHISGWGTGEVMEVSPLLERASIEFENVQGVKHLTFDKAFHCLKPLKKEHFLARRFGNPDKLELEAKNDPVKIIKLLLQDLGPKTASEIKDEMSELVIPEDEWTRWWQNTRAKLKKDTMIQSPSTQKEPFTLRKKEKSHIEQLNESLSDQSSIDSIIQKTHAFARDFPDQFKKEAIREPLKETLIELLKADALTPTLHVQIHLCLDIHFNHEIEERSLQDIFNESQHLEEIIENIDILAFRKRALMIIRETNEDWINIFLNILFTTSHGQIRDYLLSELNTGEARKALIKKLEELLEKPEASPEIFVWYFQKVAKKEDPSLPFSDKQGVCQFLESFLVLLYKIEHDPEQRALVKKMHTLLTAKRFELTRALIEGTSLEFINEFLLLVSRIHAFDDNDKKIMTSLAEVVHPSLAVKKQEVNAHDDPNVIWTTEQGYLKTQERIKEIGTVEMIQNAREVEAARALGDLRENSEYKFACERRARLQGEMKMISKQLNKARIITKHDIFSDQISVGNIVDLENENGQKVTYTILGPWDTNAEENIISYQSELAKLMSGKKVGDTVSHRDENYKILAIRSFL